MTVYAKIAQVSKAVGALATDKRNAQQGYDYISADKILDRAGREMAACGLSVVPSITAESMEAVERGGGKLRYDAVVEFDMIVAADDGTTVTVKWLGRGSDFALPDKATYKAITSGHKYFLMKLFNIGVGNEDGEHEDAPEATTTKRQPPPPQVSYEATSLPDCYVRFVSPARLRALHAAGSSFYGKDWDDKRPELVLSVTGKRTKSSKELTPDEAEKLIAGINKKADTARADQKPSNDLLFEEHFGNSQVTGAYQD